MLSPAEIEALDGCAQAELVRRGEISPHELLDATLRAIDERDAAVHAVWATWEGRARAAIDRGLPEGPWRGVPIMLKDLSLRVAGKVTTQGSRYFAGARCERSSVLTERYEAAGLVLAGKVATSEFGLGPSADTDLHPRTNNPWDLSRIAGGSSTGSAAAVAAGSVALAHASDGGGSIRIPAACCGVFGFKPSRGRITTAPMAESWSGMSTAHAITRSVRDSALLLDVSAGAVPGDPYHAPPPGGTFLAAAGRDPGRLRVAAHLLPVTGGRPNPAITQSFEDTCRLLDELGHEVILEQPAWDLDEVAALYGTITSASVQLMIDERTATLGRPPAADELLPVTRAIAERGRDRRALDLARAREACFAAAREIARFTERFDAVLCPTLAELPPAHGVLDQRSPDVDAYLERIFAFAPYTAPASLAGQPAMSVPLGWTEAGLPVGMHVSAPFGHEERLFSLAGQLERACPWSGRRPPLPTA